MYNNTLLILLLTVTIVHPQKTKISILGGGISSLSAAYNLVTHGPQDLDITVYQMGWRLGGKAHTGRNPNHGDRIEEHGVHLLFGGYRFVFPVMDKVYRALGRPLDHPLGKWDDVLLHQTEITLADFRGGTCNVSGCVGPGKWQSIPIPFPKNGPDPWKTPPSGNSPFHNSENLKKEIISLCSKYFLNLLRAMSPTSSFPSSPSLTTLIALAKAQLLPASHEYYAIFRIFLALASGLIRASFSEEGFWPYLEKRDFREFLVENGCPNDSYVLYQTPLRLAYYSSFHRMTDSNGSREEFAAATVLQMFYHTLTYRGSFAYYMLPGTGETLVLPLYQYLVNRGVKFEFFHKVVDIRTGNDKNTYVGGTDLDKGRVVGGMDLDKGRDVGGTDLDVDTVVGHTNIDVDTFVSHMDDVVDLIEIDVQAELMDPSVPYNPLINITTEKGTFEVWPNRPLYDQISVNDRDIIKEYDLESSWSSGYPVRKKYLRRGIDFDIVISGLPVAVYRHLGEGLRQSSSKWNDMVNGVQTTPTIGVQLWFTKTPQDLGVQLPSALDGTKEEFKFLAYNTPFEGFADYSHTLPYENHPQAKSVLYMSETFQPIPGPHPFTEHDYPQKEKDLLIQRVDQWLNTQFLSIYPKAKDENGGFNYNLLVDSNNGTGIERLKEQWFSVNIDPSNLYTLATNGTHQFRLRPDEAPWKNLFLVGDWTNLDYDLGCADNAVYSGEVAAKKVIDQLGDQMSYM